MKKRSFAKNVVSILFFNSSRRRNDDKIGGEGGGLTSRKSRLEPLESRELLAADPLSGAMFDVASSNYANFADESQYADVAIPLDVLNTSASVSNVDSNSLLATTNSTWTVTSTGDSETTQGTLRYAINNAASGDTIIFDSSLKGETITLDGKQLEITKSLTIDASELYEATSKTPGITINANGLSRVVKISGETISEPVRMIGLGITGGYADDDNDNNGRYGGGFYTETALELTYCSITRNTSQYEGGGVYFASCDVTMTNCVVEENLSNDGYGSAVGSYEYDGTLTLSYSSVSQNIGGGIYARNVTAHDCVISENSSYGVYSDYDGDVIITNSVVSENSSYGIYFGYGETIIITNSVVFGNQDGGVHIYEGAATITNSTIAGNKSSYYGGGICSESAEVALFNTIVACNWAKEGNNDYCGDISPESEDNALGFDPGLIVAPNFDFDGNLTNAVEVDLHLAQGAWAIDRGDNSRVIETKDLDGNDRVVTSWTSNPAVDIGAYEYQETFEYVGEAKSLVVTTLEDVVTDDGETSLREAILGANDGETIIFAPNLDNGTIILNGSQLFVDKGIVIDASSLSNGLTINETKSRMFLRLRIFLTSRFSSRN